MIEQYKAQNPSVTEPLLQTIESAWQAYFGEHFTKLLPQDLASQDWQTIAQKLQENDGALSNALKTQHEKFAMHLAALTASRLALTNASQALSSPSSSTASSNVSSEQLIKSSESVLAPHLDKEFGSSVSDHAVFRALPAKMEQSFMDDMAALRVEPPTTLTRVTEYVPEIITFVEKIIKNGFAYATDDGSVYFDVRTFDGAKGGVNHANGVKYEVQDEDWSHTYAKLQPWSKGDSKLLQEGEGALTDGNSKRSASDFALWKASKPGEPAWDSPWGKGRPGWHIECSVMASEVLGETMDIHSGGSDLAFPHHDNEIAQSEACHDCRQWVNYFIHTGHLHIEGLKMSKSLKNFITIKEALGRHSARQLRMAFMSQPWHGKMDFKEAAMIEVRGKEALFNVRLHYRASICQH